MKIFIYPPNSMILQDLVERFGHTPLALAKEIERRVNDPELDSPPMNITDIDVKIGLKYAAIEVPSGVRGRLAMFGPLIDEAEAAIIVNNFPSTFGCMACARTNELTIYLIKQRRVPTLELDYPTNEEEVEDFIARIKNFLEGLK